MTNNGTVGTGRQIKSPASAGSRGLAKLTQFTNDKTQMQLGQEAIAESMVEIRSILNRIDGVNAPVQEAPKQSDIDFTKLMLDISAMKDRIAELPIDDDAKTSALTALGQVEDDISMDESAVQEDIGDKGRIALEKAGFDPMKVKEYMAVFNDHGDTSDIDQMNMDKVGLADAMAMVLASHDVENESTTEDSGELSRLKELSGIEENAKVNFSPEQIKQLMMWNKKYSVYSGKNGDELPSGLVKANTDSGITSDGYEENEVKQYEKMFGKEEFDWDDSQHGEFQEKSKITGGMMSDLEKIVGVGNADDEYTLAEIGEKILGMSFGDTYEEQYQPFPEGDEFDIEEDEDFEEVLGPLGFPEDETELFDAEYQGRKVPLNKPMRGDTKKFKVYVKDPKTGNVKKVNFGHGGTSAKRKTMRIRKSNPKARKSFRARHNCANPGPKTKARYWSCRKW
jgi:hypothetical protein